MSYFKIKSHAKINLALHIINKSSSLHKIESLIAFVSLHDDIFIKDIKSKNHKISFIGKFSNKISKKNTISLLLKILEKKKLLGERKFHIKINKKIPIKAGFGGGSINAASILRYLIKKKIINTPQEEIIKICKLIGSDVILGLNPTNSILTSNNRIKFFYNHKTFYTLIVKPSFGCSSKEIYSKVRKFDTPRFNKPSKKMFNFNFVKKMDNSLEKIALNKYPKLKKIKFDLENLSKPDFVRMTGSGSAFVAYFRSKQRCEFAKKNFIKIYKNYWCITSKTI
ncbi:4-(cytidine 5'-diphospho)-2-C-methyl-D-erythritol kinase [Pelagibacterales bacterium SAG-MED13]|nr:4-(cytidine 5'-diphospho)-2-C-methyl-D-erythritol kinase [Pelagibacterales bacterium SAG-MED13]